MADPKVQQAAVAAASLSLAQTDLVTLQTFQSLATAPTTTISQLAAAFVALPANLGDPGRISTIQGLSGGYQMFLSNLATLISQTNAAAGN